ncbi:major facilitator superfamily transporter sugar [Mollisia scopiformis]|uniref:Major facilitator superfamily transporter sugar n=1 Tax=Mollisia scopiformis TaxID=149040 RepID=A0A194WZF6_MOLSC|nr:major facilitator superfamily transporter sugar [Mollisia scopiformis]KUJ12987.1 major facilitator superfamily transporter sugar [Mollisia scopiformis]
METYSFYNVSVVLFAAFGSLFTGYSLAIIVQTVGQPTWYKSLHLEPTTGAPGYSHTTSIIGASNGVFFAGGTIGCLLGGWLGDRLGRVHGFRVAALVGIIGAAIQTGAVNQAMWLVGRVITGLAAGQTMAAMPTYFSEVSPPHSRGLMAGAHGSVPESPRWLVSKGQDEKALDILCKLHHDPADPEDHFAHQELRFIKSQLEVDFALITEHGQWQLFTIPTYRRRSILGFVLMMGGQNIGVLVINNYNTLLYQSLGLSNTQALVVSAAYNTWAAFANMGGATVSDRLGRRKALLVGYAGCIVMFTVATGLIAKFSENASKTYAAAAVTFLFLYVFFYGAFIDVNQYTVATEIFPSHLRSQGSSYSLAAFFLTDVLWVDLAATAQATIGWKYYLVFLCLGIVHFIHLWFKLPEVCISPSTLSIS